jgi:hypothetical protein
MPVKTFQSWYDGTLGPELDKPSPLLLYQVHQSIAEERKRRWLKVVAHLKTVSPIQAVMILIDPMLTFSDTTLIAHRWKHGNYSRMGVCKRFWIPVEILLQRCRRI